MAGTFDFCPKSRVAEEIPPDEADVMSLNGWVFHPRAKIPYRPTFKVTLYGLRWYLVGAGLDLTTNPTLNAGRLLNFYIGNRKFGTFDFNHEYRGNIICQFDKPVTIPAAEPDSGGLVKPFDVTLVQYNSAW
jgi:hypothetical protein